MQEGGRINIFALRACDLVFNRKSDGIVSCGYKISNALLDSTLNMHIGGNNAAHNAPKLKNKSNETDMRVAKLMEDLVVPSGLYYCQPLTKHKVFNYKNKNKKGNDSGDNDSDSDSGSIIDESLYDKLLDLVSPDKRKKYDKKTRKHGSIIRSRQIKIDKPNEMGEAGEKTKLNINKNKNKTKKVSFRL